MKISITNSQKDLPLKNIKKTILEIVPRIVELEMRLQDPSLTDEQARQFWSEVSFQFVGEKKISQLHDEFFNDPTITDCITFPVDLKEAIPPRVLGEVFVCPKVALDYAKRHGVDPYRETILYIVHGLLHLLGYDDLKPSERKVMRAKERTYMKLVA
jgi:probable rRNA maturation factor